MTALAEKPQNMRELDNANRIRVARAELKRAVKAGEVRLCEVLWCDFPDWLNGMRIQDLLNAARGMGTRESSRMLDRAFVHPHQELGLLTVRMREEIAELGERWQRRQKAYVLEVAA